MMRLDGLLCIIWDHIVRDITVTTVVPLRSLLRIAFIHAVFQETFHSISLNGDTVQNFILEGIETGSVLGTRGGSSLSLSLYLSLSLPVGAEDPAGPRAL